MSVSLSLSLRSWIFIHRLLSFTVIAPRGLSLNLSTGLWHDPFIFEHDLACWKDIPQVLFVPVLYSFLLVRVGVYFVHSFLDTLAFAPVHSSDFNSCVVLVSFTVVSVHDI